MKKIVFFILTISISITALAQPATSWSAVGPIAFPINSSGQINGIGRVTQLKFDPINVNTMYATSASGGLWRSIDTAATWVNVGTDYFPKMECASICIDHTNNNILYLGSGDPNYYGSGFGVWKSTNAGTSWALSNSGIATGLIVELVMNPTNNQQLIAATNNGIYKTTNAGANWSLVKTGGDFKAMLLKPNSADTLYAVTSSEVWRSLNFGTSWQQITSGVTVPGGNGQGMRLAVSKASPNVVYVSMIANEGLTLKSTNFGTSFTTVYNNAAQSLVGYDATTPGQGDYNFGMTADPNNANIVYIAAHCVWKSTNGGVAWSKLTNWAVDCHTDMHGIRVHPTYTNMLFDVNDGGVFLSRDGGITWQDRSDGIGATEIYHAAQSKLQRNLISIGTQDNGELYFNNSTWFTNRGGDWGSKMLFSYNSANTVYYYENGKRRAVNGSENSYNLPFVAGNNINLDFNKKINNKAFCALQNIYLCNSITSPTPAWVQIGAATASVTDIHSSFADSSVLYVVDINNKIYRCDNVFAGSPTFTSYTTPANTNIEAHVVSIATNSNVVYLACGNTVYRSTNKGQNFTNFNTGIAGSVNIIGLYHDEYSLDESVYACTAKGVYYRNNTMTSWQNVTYNLPSIADIVEFMFFNNGTAASVLRVGYYGRGVWELQINTAQAPAPNFTVNKQTICPNTTINFTDLSYGNPTTWLWTFTGGSPATSNSTNPVVTYTASGLYPVQLSVTNVNGTSVLTQTAYINVTTAQILPVAESFSQTAFPPNNWTLFDAGNNAVEWQKSNTVGGFGLSNQSTFFDNYNFAEQGKRDAIITQNFNLTGVTNPKLTFDVAYARYDNINFDSLAVGISTNCGQSFTTVYANGNTSLTTAPDNTGFFIPLNTQWRTDTVYLSAYIGQPEVMISFENRGNYGNVLYLDNINLLASQIVTSLTKNNSIDNDFNVFPNPAAESININFSSDNETPQQLVIRDNLGKVVYHQSKPQAKLQIDLKSFAKGMYLVSIITDKNTHTKKIIVE